MQLLLLLLWHAEPVSLSAPWTHRSARLRRIQLSVIIVSTIDAYVSNASVTSAATDVRFHPSPPAAAASLNLLVISTTSVSHYCDAPALLPYLPERRKTSLVIMWPPELRRRQLTASSVLANYRSIRTNISYNNVGVAAQNMTSPCVKQ